MKNLLLIFSMAVGFNQFASAESSITCREPGMADAGFIVRVYSDTNGKVTRVDLSEDNFTGAILLEHLSCISTKASYIPDGMQDRYKCIPKRFDNQSYMVILTDADFAGIHYAKIYQKTLSGLKNISTVPCQR